MDKKGKPKKKRKLKIKVLLKIIVVLLCVALIICYINNLKIKNIYIKGNELTKDVEIIEMAQIEDYPNIYKLNTKRMKNRIKELPLIDDVKIKRNIFGELTIEVQESKIFFYYSYINQYITSSGKQIDAKDDYIGYPTLINFTPDTILNDFIIGLNKIDYNVIRMINTIEYDPYTINETTIVDDTRFNLKMNDGNTVIIDTVNIRNLDKYPTSYISLELDKNKGYIYLDTIVKDTIDFRSYEADKAEKEAKKEKEKSKEAKEKEEG